MKSVQANFKKQLRKDPEIGNFIALMRAVKYKQYSRRTLLKNFNELIEEDEDMTGGMKKILVDHLYKYSHKDPEEDCSHIKNPSGEFLIIKDE